MTTIKVTQKHIDEGTPHCPGACPVALAIMETLGCEQVSVGPSGMWMSGVGIVPTPHLVAVFISRFDSGAASQFVLAKPFEFELPL